MQTMLVGLLACCALACSSTTYVVEQGATADAGTNGDGAQPVDDDAGMPVATPDGATPAASQCDPGTKTGSASGETGVPTMAGVTMTVRTPKGYDPTQGSPLIVVYSPAGGNPAITESFTGLTPKATARGYVIAYVDHIDPSNATFPQAATVPDTVSGKWCIDPKRIYLTGHSDGGSFAEAIGLLKLAKVAAVAPSASGVNLMWASSVGCLTSPLPIMKMHSSGDQLFPLSGGFGAQVADWWSTCEQCGSASAPASDGCVVHSGCTGGAEVRYCQGTQPHPYWPALDDSILDFFDRFRLP